MTEHSLLSLIGPDGLLDEPRLEEIRAAQGWSLDRICNELAWLIAHRFLAGHMDYELGNTAINWVRGYSLTTESASLPEPCSEIYLAFDQGAFLHPSEPPDLDPVEAYTRPLLNDIVGRGDQSRA